MDLKVDRERILDAIQLGERMSPHFAMDLLEHIEGLEAHVALLKASLKQASQAEERVRVLEEALGEIASQAHNLPRSATADKIDIIARAALSTERMPSDG